MKTALKILIIITAISAVFALSVNAYDAVDINEISSENVIGNVFTLKEFDINLCNDLWDLVPDIRDSSSSVNKQFALSFYSNGKQYRGIDIMWSIDEDTNRPIIRLGYAYVNYINAYAFVPMIQPVFEYILNTSSTYTIITDNTESYKEIVVKGGIDYTNGNLISLLNTIYEYKTYISFNDDNNIIEGIENNTAQDDYQSFYNILSSIVTNNNIAGVFAYFYVMASIMDTRLQLALQFIILFGTGILVFKLLARIVTHVEDGGKRR